MRLLFYDMELPELIADKGESTGGAAVRQLAISHGLIELGHEVGILTWKGANSYVDKKLLIDLIESRPRPDKKSRFKLIKANTYYFLLMYLAARAYKPDVLIKKAFSVHNGVIALIASMLNIPFIYLVANDKDVDDRYKIGQNYFVIKSFKYAIQQSELIVCQNKYQYQQILERYPGKKLLLMTNPFYHNDNLPVIKPFIKRKYIAWVGLFTPQKNLPLLLEIARKLPEFKFKVAGMAPRKNPKIELALKELKELDNVELAGYIKRNDIIEFLGNAYLLLNTSHYEGFSNTYLESFAAGSPVVARENVDPDQIIKNHKLGVSTSDNSEFPYAIRSLIREPDYEMLTHRCREYLLKYHDVQLLCKKFEESIKSIT